MSENLKRIAEIARHIAYKDWALDVIERDGEVYIRWRWVPPAYPPWPVPAEVRSRKWFVSRHSTTSEIVRTAFAAALLAEEHEAREHFLWCKRAVFGPHLSVLKLHQLMDGKDAHDRRPGSPDVVADDLG
jgi:hypothetical protein